MALSQKLLALVCLALCATSVAQCHAQRMFLDTTVDGKCDHADGLRTAGTCAVDIYLETNARDSGNATAARNAPDEVLTFNSYEFILRVSGGKVKWGTFRNAQPAMSTRIGPFMNESDFYVAQLGMTTLPAGRYKLGTLEVTVVSGAPTLAFASNSKVWQGAGTSFGSMCPGLDDDNTLKLSPAVESGSTERIASPGDWGDAVGLRSIDSRSLESSAAAGHSTVGFASRLVGNNPSEMQVVVTTSKPGRLRVQLFDSRGRLVRVIANQDRMESGEHVYSLDGGGKNQRLGSAVYYYRVEATEGTLTGKVVLVR